jgi:hypothetical protein
MYTGGGRKVNQPFLFSNVSRAYEGVFERGGLEELTERHRFDRVI